MEKINTIIKVTKEDESKYLMFATKKGIVKRTDIKEFESIRTSGKICISLKDNDELLDVRKTSGENIILLGDVTLLPRVPGVSEVVCMTKSGTEIETGILPFQIGMRLASSASRIGSMIQWPDLVRPPKRMIASGEEK